MKKQTAILLNSTISLLGYYYENNLMLGVGVLCLTLVLISKTKKHGKHIL